MGKVTGFDPSLSTVGLRYGPRMGYEVLLTDDTVETIADADSYAQEGPLTTFFAVDEGRQPRLDAWCHKLGSVRTDRIVRIRRAEVSAPSGVSNDPMRLRRVTLSA